MRMKLLTLILIACAFRTGHVAAQDGGYRFAPPPPPPLDGADFDDDEEIDSQDYPVPPPPPGGSAAGLPPPGPGDSYTPPMGNAGFSGGGGSARSFGDLTTTPQKFRFQIVDGEYFEKGKKRGRGQSTRVSGSPSGS